MTKRFKQKINSVFSITNIILLTFQSFLPGFFAFMPLQAHAQEIVSVGQVDLDFSKDSHEFDLEIESTNDLSYEINYELNNTEEKTQSGIKGIAVSKDGIASATEFAGSCSTDGCTEDDFDFGVLEIPAAEYEAEFILDSNILWLLADNTATVSEVRLDTIYSAPQNGEVQVVFTKLPENPGSLSIEEITLSEEQVSELGAYSNVAYDITSDMDDGSFEYELKLPLPEGADETAGLVYAESIEELDKAVAVESDEVVSGKVVAKGLDHFTIFVVADPIPVANGAACTVASISGICYDDLQTAVNAAVSGDTIELASDITLGHRVDINTTLTLDGNGNTIFASFAKTSNSNNAALGIFGDNIVIKDMIIDGSTGTNLHGINTYIADNVLVDEVTVKNFRAGIIVNGSTVDVNNITTSGNSWGGINVDLGTGVTSPAILTVTGTSVHDEATHIWLDDITKAVSVVDVAGQYSFSNPVGNLGLYTLQDKTAPTVSNIKMFVNGVESTFMRAGDNVTVQAEITDVGSGVGSVRLLARSIVTTDGGYIDSGYFVNTTGDIYERSFVFPADGKYIDTHKPIFTYLDAHSFYIKAFDKAGNYTNSPSTKFTYDKEIPAMDSIKMYVSDDGVNFTESAFVSFGQFVRVEVETTDALSRVKTVEFRIQNKDTGEYVVARVFETTPVAPNLYRYSFQIPADEKYINTHAPISQVLNQHRFWARTTDNVGNYNHGISGEFTYDNTAPDAPSNLGFNSSVADYSQEPVEVACGGYVNLNQVSHHWTPVGDAVKYQRQWVYPGKDHTVESNWQGAEEWTSTYTNYRSFGGGGGTEGLWHVRVRAQDAAGNWSAYSDACAVTYDKTAPAKPTGLKRLGLDGKEYSCSDYSLRQNMVPMWDANTEPDFDHYEYSSFHANGSQGLNEKELTTNSLPNTWVAPVDGTYGFAVRAVDKVGNKSDWALTDETWAGSCQITYDSTAPSTPTVLGFKSPDLSCGAITNIHSTTVDWSDSVDSVVGFDHYEYNIDYPKPDGSRGQWTTTLTPSQYSGSLNEGAHHIRVRGVDKLGNTSDWSNTCTITTDWEAPDVAVTAPAAGLVTGTVDIRGTVTDDNPHHYWFVIQNSSGTTVAGPGVVNDTSSFTDKLLLNWDTSSLPSGEYTIKLEARDSANNKDSGSVSWVTVLVDNDKPSSTITTFGLADGGSVETASFSGQIQGTATDLPVPTNSGVKEILLEIMHTPFGATESSYWNGSDWQSGLSQVKATGTTSWEYQITPPEKVLEGTYKVTSHAVDNSGNVEDTYTITIVYDKTIPEVVLTMDPTNPDGRNSWYVTEPTVTLAASDNYVLDHIEYQWNSTTGTWLTYSSPITPPGEGQNILYYRSIDKVGNVSDLGVKEVKYDKTAPADGAGNLQVKNIKSTTADATWNDPANSDEIDRFVLIWKHTDGSTRSKSVAGDVRELELFDLFDGEWELTLESQDAAGNAYKVTEKFTVGGSSDDGDVLGATTDTTSNTGVGGVVAGAVNAFAETSQETPEEADESSRQEAKVAGSVLGEVDSQCETWKFYLPLFLIIIQLLFAVSLEIANREPGIKKLLFALAISGLVIASFYLLRSTDCYKADDFMQLVSKWFIPISLMIAGLIRIVGSLTIEEK